MNILIWRQGIKYHLFTHTRIFCHVDMNLTASIYLFILIPSEPCQWEFRLALDLTFAWVAVGFSSAAPSCSLAGAIQSQVPACISSQCPLHVNVLLFQHVALTSLVSSHSALSPLKTRLPLLLRCTSCRQLQSWLKKKSFIGVPSSVFMYCDSHSTLNVTLFFCFSSSLTTLLFSRCWIAVLLLKCENSGFWY